MKILLLGACAVMAVPLIPRLAAEADVERITLADRNAAKAEQLAVADPKLSSVLADASDHPRVVELMRGYDLSISYIGPFYFFEKRLVRAAVEAGKPYVSICDDYDAYLDVVALEDEARKSGVKILTGFGNSPGLTQVLAKKGYLSMAKPEKIHIHWCAGSDEAAGPANLAHLFHIFTGTTLQWMEGREVRVKTGRGKKTVVFPEPIGQVPVFYTGHAESVSIPRNLPGLTEVTLHGGVKPVYIVKLVKAMAALGLTKKHRSRTSLARFFHRIEGWFVSEGIDKSVGRVEVYGKDEGGAAQSRAYSYVGHIADITSIPCLTAALWLGRGKFDALPGGVYAPERVIDDPDVFLQDLVQRGVEIHA